MTCVHLVEHACLLGFVGEMLLGFEDEVCREVGIPKKCPYTFQGVAIVDFKGFPCDDNLFTVKTWPSRGQVFINDPIELTRVLE